MKTLKINLLADNTIFVGEVTKKADLLHTFYVKDIEELDKFFATNTIPYEQSHTSISIKHSAIGYSAVFNDAKRTRIAMAFLAENSLIFQKSSGKKFDLYQKESQKRSNNSKRNLTLRVSINVFCSSFFLYCKRSPCFSLEIFSLIRNIIF